MLLSGGRFGPLNGTLLNFDHTNYDGVTNQTRNVVNTESFHQLGAVSFDRLDADFQKLRDLLSGLTFGDEADVFRNRCVRRACPLAVDDLMEIFRIVDVCWFHALIR